MDKISTSGWQKPSGIAAVAAGDWCGRILFELEGVSPELAKEAMKLASAKLPLKTKFVTRSVTGE